MRHVAHSTQTVNTTGCRPSRRPYLWLTLTALLALLTPLAVADDHSCTADGPPGEITGLSFETGSANFSWDPHLLSFPCNTV